MQSIFHHPNIHKFRSLSLIPKAKIKRKKFLAVSFKESISFFDNILQAPRLKRILQNVILLSVLVIFSTPSSIFSTMSLSSCTMKCFSPSKPKESKKKISVFGSILVHYTSERLVFHCGLSVFDIINGYFPLSDIIEACSIHLPI